MEVRQWLAPLTELGLFYDPGRAQDATRVDAEQTSKRTLRRPTHLPMRAWVDDFRAHVVAVSEFAATGARTS